MSERVKQESGETYLALSLINIPNISGNNPIAAISRSESYKKYGVTKNQVASMLLNLFHYPAQYADTLQNYYILHWEGSHLDTVMVDGTVQGTDGVTYLIVYQGCTPFGAKRAKQLKLSFRNPRPEFGLHAYVLIRSA